MTDQRRAARVDQHTAQEQAHRITGVLENLRPNATAGLTRDPFAILRGWDEVEVRLVPETETDAGCSVAGAYLAGASPPRLAVAASLSTRRQAFTVLHELGHHLQQSDLTLMAPLLDQPDDGQGLEDAACDAFAAEILLPGTVTQLHLADGVTAPAIARLWDASPQASRAAACVRAAQRLTAPGQIVLLDGTGVVQFAAAHGLPPVGRGSNQADIAVVRDALRSSAQRAQGRTSLAYRDGIHGQELYAQASNIGGFLVLVVTTDHAPWETRFHLPVADDGPRGRAWTCEQCGEDFTTYAAPCTRCKAPTCPACGRCDCTPKVAERRCEGCNLVHPLRMFDGDSARCRDCA